MTLARYILGMLLLMASHAIAQREAQALSVRVLDRQGRPVEAITDGDLISIDVRLAQAIAAPAAVSFGLNGASRPVAACVIPAGEIGCASEAFAALGWYWSDERKAQPRRTIQATLAQATPAAIEIEVAARPVVLVHGFISDAATWAEYTRPNGFLALFGMQGYAVGDGQVPGMLRIGDIEQPSQPTNSIAQNAAELARYIAGIKQHTGAEQVDLVAHSMGGLIARYYIDRLMPQRDVAQLLMLGTSHGGSPCAQLPASLGWYLPAALELRPAYVSSIFNRQITRRQGVPFHQLAGTSIVEAFKSPCTVVPSDLVVDRGSVSSIAAPLTELPELHTALTESSAVFATFVAPRLQTAAGMFAPVPDPPLPQASAREIQFTKLLSGRIAAGTQAELRIDLDRVAVASFALFDPTHSLTVQVIGASGAAITLDPVTHGMIVVDDPAALFNLGYGFSNPAPGAWKIILAATPATPSGGAPYALSTRVAGGATLHAAVDHMAPRLGESVMVSANLELAGEPRDAAIEALVRAPDGTSERHVLNGDRAAQQLALAARSPGLYTVDIIATGTADDGSPIERSAFLAFEAQPASSTGRRNLLLVQAGLAGLIVCLGVWLLRRRRGRQGTGERQA